MLCLIVNTGPEERKHLAACERALKEKGSLEQITMHCVFLGLPRSGKSSLIRRLLGKRLSMSTSTGVAEKAIKVEIRKSTAQVSGLLWCELEDLDDEAILVMCNLSKTAPVDLTAHTTDDSQPGKGFSLSQFFRNLFTRGSRNKQHKKAASSSPSLVESQSPGEQGMKPPLDMFRDAFRKKQSKLKELVDEPWMLYITDTGGQPEFQELLPILVSGPSLFFLVFSLHLELNKKFRVEYITSHGKVTVPYEAGLTVLEMLLQSLATIASTSVSRMVGDRKVMIQPNIFFVATHKDLVSEEHIHQVDITLQEVVKGTEAYKDGMVQFGSESQMVIAVNNLAEGEEDVQQIRAAVDRIGKRGDDYRVKTPFSWLMFSNIIQQMKSPVLQYEQCYSVAQQCGIDTREEMNDALRFLHENVGVVRYYHDVSELQHFVIKDPQYVFDVITDLIVSTFTFDHADPVLHEQFTKKGIFPLDVFEKLAKSTEFLPPSKLITLLQHLNIVALLKKDGASPHYFMPCVLAHSEGGKPIESSSTSRIPSLLVAFKSGYCPKGLFGALVVYLLQDKMKSKLEWELEQDKIFRDQIRFSVGPYDSFQLKVLPTYLSIDLCFSTGASERRLSLVSVCSEVRCCISSGIVEVSETLHCSRKAAFSFGFFCPEKLGTDKSSHPAIVNFLDGQPCNLTCPLTHKRFDLPDEYQVWFNEVSYKIRVIATCALTTLEIAFCTMQLSHAIAIMANCILHSG